MSENSTTVELIRGSNTDGSITMAFANFLRALEKIPQLQVWGNLGGFPCKIENGIFCVLIRIPFMLKKIEKISLFCLLTWRYD